METQQLRKGAMLAAGTAAIAGVAAMMTAKPRCHRVPLPPECTAAPTHPKGTLDAVREAFDRVGACLVDTKVCTPHPLHAPATWALWIAVAAVVATVGMLLWQKYGAAHFDGFRSAGARDRAHREDLGGYGQAPTDQYVNGGYAEPYLAYAGELRYPAVPEPVVSVPEPQPVDDSNNDLDFNNIFDRKNGAH